MTAKLTITFENEDGHEKSSVRLLTPEDLEEANRTNLLDVERSVMNRLLPATPSDAFARAKAHAASAMIDRGASDEAIEAVLLAPDMAALEALSNMKLGTP